MNTKLNKLILASALLMTTVSATPIKTSCLTYKSKHVVQHKSDFRNLSEEHIQYIDCMDSANKSDYIDLLDEIQSSDYPALKIDKYYSCLYTINTKDVPTLGLFENVCVLKAEHF